MSSLQGNFVWYELMTPDAKAAESFYNHVIGWSARDAGMPMPYTIFSNDTGMVCGMMQAVRGLRRRAAGMAGLCLGR